MDKNQQLLAVLAVLNDAFGRDPKALQALMLTMRVPCTKQLGEHPTIPVEEVNGAVTVSALGILNGVIFKLTGQMIAAEWSETTGSESPQLLGFTHYTGPLPRKAVESGLQRSVP